MINIALLGSTGSIGQQTLEVIAQFPDRFKLLAIAAGSNLDLLIDQVRKFRPRYVAIGREDLYPKLKEMLKETGIDPQITVLSGISGLKEIVTIPEVNLVLTAVVGAIGIEPTLAAIQGRKRIALANKETLVAAGSIIIPEAQKNNVRIIPVDSEHSAIFQCLEGRNPSQVERLILTASGGSFRDRRPEDLEEVTIEEALNHPNWSMGGKITIDSATMFNKGLEVIEAHWLFNMSFDRIDVVIHPESIVHSMVELVDGSIIAQMGLCDMKLPIQLALTYPERLVNHFPKLNLLSGAVLHFQPVNPKLYPAVELAYQAGRIGGSLPAALNAANEEAVGAFLKGKIKFNRIISIVSDVIGHHQKESFSPSPDLKEILEVDKWARETANKYIRGYQP